MNTTQSHHITRVLLALASCFVLLLTSCGSADDATIADTATNGDDDNVVDEGSAAAPIDLDALTSQTWTLAAGGGPDGEIKAVDGFPLTITFDLDGRVTGTASCNGYSGSYQIDGNQLVVDEIGLEEMACEPDVQAPEASFVAALADVTDINLVGDQLGLSGIASELIFAPASS